MKRALSEYFDFGAFGDSAVFHRTKGTWHNEKNPYVIYGILSPLHNLIKIGYTNNIKLRINSFIGQSPVKLKLEFLIEIIVKDYLPPVHFARKVNDLEKKIHKLFEKHRRHGEWFEYSDEIKDYVARFLAQELIIK